ncbi:Checkpoint protein hus1 [Taxawa tesnikishii (nom. ined.)]|nr:Checkpoint protein hus1 [Dothideales sp. JES 119]
MTVTFASQSSLSRGVKYGLLYQYLCVDVGLVTEPLPSKDTIFETYTIQSAAESNTINLEVPLAPLHRALKSAQNATSASIRLTKRMSHPPPSAALPTRKMIPEESVDFGLRTDRETVITQDIPIRVLAPTSVQGLHEPRVREPDVHIMLPPLLQLKGISDRLTRLALSSTKSAVTSSGFRGSSAAVPKLELSANMHGCLRLGLRTDAMNISSTWTGLTNPELDPGHVEGGDEGVETHPSTRMKMLGDAEGFCDDHALILYVYLPNDAEGGDEESVLTVTNVRVLYPTHGDNLELVVYNDPHYTYAAVLRSDTIKHRVLLETRGYGSLPALECLLELTKELVGNYVRSRVAGPEHAREHRSYWARWETKGMLT